MIGSSWFRCRISCVSTGTWRSDTSAIWDFGSTGNSRLSPVQMISFFGMELDSVNLTARLIEERVWTVLNCLNCLVLRFNFSSVGPCNRCSFRACYQLLFDCSIVFEIRKENTPLKRLK